MPGGPSCVISDKAVMRFYEQTKEMYLDCYYPGTTPGEIRECTGFPIDIARAKLLDTPTDRELDILHKQVDPQRLILGSNGLAPRA
jgi:glutaconate CoA-transferase subunit B